MHRILIWSDAPPEGISSAMKMKTHDQAHFSPYDTYTICDQVASHTHDKISTHHMAASRIDTCIKILKYASKIRWH
jgi:hypothetical protein